MKITLECWYILLETGIKQNPYNPIPRQAWWILGRYKHLYRRSPNNLDLTWYIFLHLSFSSSSMCTINLHDKSFYFPLSVGGQTFSPECNASFGAERGWLSCPCTSHSPGPVSISSVSLRSGFSPECAWILFFGVIPACTRSLNSGWLFA